MKSSRYSLLIMVAALYASGAGSISIAGTTSPQMSGAVTSVQYGEKITTYVYDEGGNLIYISMGGLEDKVLEYADPNRLVRVFRPLSMGDPNIVSLEYDSFGRLFSVRRHNQEIDERIEDRLGYDGRGNLIEVQSIYEDSNSFVEGAMAVGRGLVPLGGPEKIIYEKTETTVDGANLRIGDITYHEYDDEGRISRKIEGYSGDEAVYQYDPFEPNRLASIIEPEDSILYHYDSNGRLECSDYSDDNFDYCVQYRESDFAGHRIVKMISDTNSSDPNLTALGVLGLDYDSNDMLFGISYTTDESAVDVMYVMCVFSYEYDGLGRIIKVTCESPSEPNLVITIDPDIPDTGAYMVTQYEYDSLGRRIYTFTTCGHVARTLYHDMLSMSQTPRPMLEVDVVNPDLHAPPKLLSYEYDSEGRLLRCSDLMGHYVVFSPLGGGGQYAAGLGGGGQYFFTLGGGGQYGLLGGGGGIGKMLGMFGFDEYGNPDILLEDEESSDIFGALKKKVKKKISLKAAKKKTAPVGCKELLEGDLNGDCTINFRDLAVMAGNWLEDQST
jgi:hypothetical protein